MMLLSYPWSQAVLRKSPRFLLVQIPKYTCWNTRMWLPSNDLKQFELPELPCRSYQTNEEMNWLFWYHFKSSGLFRPSDCFERKSWHSSWTDWSVQQLIWEIWRWSRKVKECNRNSVDLYEWAQGWDYQNHGNWNVSFDVLEDVNEYERCSRQATVRRAVPFHTKSVCSSAFQCSCRTPIFSFIKYKNETQEQSTSRHDRLTDACKAAGLSCLRNRARLGNSFRYTEESYGLLQGERRRDQWALDIARVEYTWSSGEGVCVWAGIKLFSAYISDIYL